MTPRYEVKLIDHQGGRRVVHIWDSVECKVHMVYRRGRSFLHFGNDRPVYEEALKRVAREALA